MPDRVLIKIESFNHTGGRGRKCSTLECKSMCKIFFFVSKTIKCKNLINIIYTCIFIQTSVIIPDSLNISFNSISVFIVINKNFACRTT